MDTTELPLFPLNAVLFPGGRLALRVFETRYLDLIGECSRTDHGFGVCLIADGQEAGVPAVPAAVGCEARISDFTTTREGLLGLIVDGARRFHVNSTHIRNNGLVVGDVSWFDAPVRARVQPEHELLATLLARILDCAGSPFDKIDKALLQDAEWVSWRLAEWLPLSWHERQALLQMQDANARLQYLVERIPDFQQE